MSKQRKKQRERERERVRNPHRFVCVYPTTLISASYVRTIPRFSSLVASCYAFFVYCYSYCPLLLLLLLLLLRLLLLLLLPTTTRLLLLPTLRPKTLVIRHPSPMWHATQWRMQPNKARSFPLMDCKPCSSLT